MNKPGCFCLVFFVSVLFSGGAIAGKKDLLFGAKLLTYSESYQISPEETERDAEEQEAFWENIKKSSVFCAEESDFPVPDGNKYCLMDTIAGFVKKHDMLRSNYAAAKEKVGFLYYLMKLEIINPEISDWLRHIAFSEVSPEHGAGNKEAEQTTLQPQPEEPSHTQRSLLDVTPEINFTKEELLFIKKQGLDEIINMEAKKREKFIERVMDLIEDEEEALIVRAVFCLCKGVCLFPPSKRVPAAQKMSPLCTKVVTKPVVDSGHIFFMVKKFFERYQPAEAKSELEEEPRSEAKRRKTNKKRLHSGLTGNRKSQCCQPPEIGKKELVQVVNEGVQAIKEHNMFNLKRTEGGVSDNVDSSAADSGNTDTKNTWDILKSELELVLAGFRKEKTKNEEGQVDFYEKQTRAVLEHHERVLADLRKKQITPAYDADDMNRALLFLLLLERVVHITQLREAAGALKLALPFDLLYTDR